MSLRWVAMIISSWATCAAAATAHAQRYPPPFPREGVTKALENDLVVVWKGVTGFKSRPTAMHQHTMDEVAVMLDDGGRARIRLPDGSVRESGSVSHRGDVFFQPSGIIHSEEALVDGIRGVALELKSQRNSDHHSSTGEPSICPQEAVTQRLENDRVAAWECHWDAGSIVPIRGGVPDAILVPLESGSLRLVNEKGASRLVQLAFGEPISLRRGDDVRLETAGGTPRAILIELK